MKSSRLAFFTRNRKREKEGYTRSTKALLVDCEQKKDLRKGMCGC